MCTCVTQKKLPGVVRLGSPVCAFANGEEQFSAASGSYPSKGQ